jgi:hypothetical protein
MKQHWTRLTKIVGHKILPFRRLFLRHHRNADEIVISNEGVPVMAIYYSCEAYDNRDKYPEITKVMGLLQQGLDAKPVGGLK